MGQNTIDSKTPDTLGIKCYVRCTSNKIDTAKENVRSINLNFDIRVGDELVGKGNNLNINNITPEAYENLCKAFGVEDINENTPFFAELMTLHTQERRGEWVTAMERKDKRIDDDQTDVTRDPNLLTERQEALLNDWIEKDAAAKKKANKFLKGLEMKEIGELNVAQASQLIAEVKPLADKKEGDDKPKKPKK